MPRKNEYLLEPVKNNRYYTWRPIYIYDNF